MALTLQQFKEQNPEYGDIEDGVLADYLHKKYYSHIEPSSFYKQISYDDPNADGDFTRGVKDSFKQLPELGYGLVAGAGATGETLFGNNGLSSDVKNFAVDKIKQEEKDLAKTSKDSDSLTYSLDAAKQGDLGSLVDWAQRSSGYALGQGAQLVATGGVGGILGKAGAHVVVKQTVKNMAIKEAERLAATDAAKGLAADEIAKLATANVASKLSSFGANTAIGASAYGMEGGEIGGDLAKQSVDENRVLTPNEITRGLGATAAAGALEFAGDKLGLNILTGKSKLFNSFDSKPGIMGKVARGSMAGIAAAPVEGGTEYAQTLIENYGKGKDPFSEKSKQDAFDAAGQGFLGGAVMAGAGGMLTQAKTPEQRDVDINHDILNAPSIDDAIDVMGKAVNEPVDNVVNRIVGSESGGRDNAKNPLSSAAGAGQFIDSTWLDMLHKHRPDLVEGRTKEQLLALKMNGDLSREMTAHYAQDNADALQRNGFDPSPENIYLAHHFGIGGASNLLSANPNAPASSVMDAMVIRANPYMQGKTVGQVRDWVANRMKPIEGELLPPEHPVNRYKGPQGYIEGGAIDSELNRLGLPAPDEAQQRTGILANAIANRSTPELGTATTEPSASVEEASTPVAANEEPFAPTHRLDDGTEVAYGEDSFGPHFVDANGDQFEYTDSALPLGQTKQQAPISQEEDKQPEVEQDNQFVTVTDKVTGKSFNVIKSDYEAGKEKLAAYNSDTNKALNIKLPIKNVTPITQAAETITNEGKVQPVSLDAGAAPGGNVEAVGNGETRPPVLGKKNKPSKATDINDQIRQAEAKEVEGRVVGEFMSGFKEERDYEARAKQRLDFLDKHRKHAAFTQSLVHNDFEKAVDDIYRGRVQKDVAQSIFSEAKESGLLTDLAISKIEKELSNGNEANTQPKVSGEKEVAQPTEQELKDYGLLYEDNQDRWKYKFAHDASKHFFANSKESAIEEATKAFHNWPEAERKTKQQASDDQNSQRIEAIDKKYKAFSVEKLNEKIAKLEADKATLRKAGEREFNGNGGRRTSAAVSNEAARDTAQEIRDIQSHLERRNTQPTETNAPSDNSELELNKNADPVKQQTSKPDGLDSNRENVDEKSKSGTFISDSISVIANQQSGWNKDHFVSNVAYTLNNTNLAAYTDGENFYFSDGTKYAVKPNGMMDEFPTTKNFQSFDSKLRSGIQDKSLSYNAKAKSRYESSIAELEKEQKRKDSIEEENKSKANQDYLDSVSNKEAIDKKLDSLKLADGSGIVNLRGYPEPIKVTGKVYKGLIVAKNPAEEANKKKPWWVIHRELGQTVHPAVKNKNDEGLGFRTKKEAEVYMMRLADAAGVDFTGMEQKDLVAALKVIRPSLGYSAYDYYQAYGAGNGVYVDPFEVFDSRERPVQETPKNEQVAEDVSKKEEKLDTKDYFKDKAFLKFLAKQKVDIAPEEGAPTQKVSATVAIDSLDKQIEALKAFIDCVKG